MFTKCFSNTVFLSLLFFIFLLSSKSFSKTYYTVATGNIQTDPIWSLSGSPPGYLASALGGFSDSVDLVIQSGTIADINNIISTDVRDINVMPGGQLLNSGSTNRYLNVFGDIDCNGVIGDGLQYNPVSFNIEGDSCEITGTGQFDCSRIRKNSNTHIQTVLILKTEVRLWYDLFSSVAFYNNSYGGRLDLIIFPNASLRLLGASGNASFSIDGTNGAGIFDNHGMVDIYGSLEVSGVLYMSNNNPSQADSCIYVVRNNGNLIVGSIDASPGLNAISRIRVEGGGTLELSGTPPFLNFSLLTNEFELDVNSITRYSCNCDQVLNHELKYGDLELSGSGKKYFMDSTLIKNSLFITGNARAAGGTAYVELYGDWVSNAPDGWLSGQCQVSFSGTSDQIYDSSGEDSLYALTISKPAGNVIIHDSLMITGTLTMNNGILLTTDTSMLIIDSTASVVNPSYNSFVGGPVIKCGADDFMFPIGDSVYFKPFKIQSLSGASNVKVKYQRDDPMSYGYDVNNLDTGLTNVSRCEFWEVGSAEPVNAVIGVGWDSAACGITNPNTLRVARWNGMVWINEFYSTINGNATQGEILSLPGIPLIEDSTVAITLGSASYFQNPLPVKLLDFYLEQVADDILVKWTTLSEVGSSHFVVERMNDDGNFVFLSSVSAAGNSVVPIKYAFLDTSPLSGENCYRLVQYDINGDSVLVAPECITLDQTHVALTCYPNPVSEKIHVNLRPSTSDMQLIIVDGNGRKWVQNNIRNLTSQPVSFMLDVSTFHSGLYELLIISEQEIFRSCRFIVL